MYRLHPGAFAGSGGSEHDRFAGVHCDRVGELVDGVREQADLAGWVDHHGRACLGHEPVGDHVCERDGGDDYANGVGDVHGRELPAGGAERGRYVPVPGNAADAGERGAQQRDPRGADPDDWCWPHRRGLAVQHLAVRVRRAYNARRSHLGRHPLQLTICLATRARPERLIDTITRTVALMGEANTQMVVCIDDDDEATQAARAQIEGIDDRVIVDSRPREDALGMKWDRGIAYGGDCFLPQADYTPYVTPGFDSKILEAASIFPDGIGCTYTNMANASFARSQAPTRKLVEMLGYMYGLPYFPYWFVDHWLDDIVRLIDRISFADVDVDAGVKLPTQEMRDVAWWATFFDSQRLVRRRHARAIIDSPEFQEPEWRKELLRRHYPLIEYRSQNINDSVRAMQWPATLPGGARYDRLKAMAAAAMAAEWPELEKEIAA